jgi:hypothetical protein
MTNSINRLKAVLASEKQHTETSAIDKKVTSSMPQWMQVVASQLKSKNPKLKILNTVDFGGTQMLLELRGENFEMSDDNYIVLKKYGCTLVVMAVAAGHLEIVVKHTELLN